MNPTFTLSDKFHKIIARISAILLLTLSFAIDSRAVITVTIPSTPGTDTSSFTPTNRRYTFSGSRMLFTASEIGTTGTVTGMSFQKYAGSTSTSINYISIYMKETTATSVTTSLPSTFPTGYKLVYFSSYIDNTMSSGWTSVTFSTALADIFTYSGGSNNIEIVVKKISSETAVTGTNVPVYSCNTTTGTLSAYYFGTTAMGTTLTTTSTKRPNVQLFFENTCAGKPARGTVTGPTSAVCSGTNFTLNTTGLTIGTGMTYQWQSRNSGSGAFTNMGAADTFNSLTTSSTVNKDYRIHSTCVLSGQSDTSAPFTVNVVNTTTINAATDTTFCIGGSVTLLTGTPAPTGVTYTWFKGAVSTGVTGTTYSATTSGTYSLRSSSPSCSGLFSNAITVTVNPLPTATITALSSTTFCDGLSVILQASTGTGYTYQWQKGAVDISGATGSTYTATTSGSYRVLVTNSPTTCSAYSAATVVTVNTMPSAPTIYTTSGATSYCRGDSLILTAIPTSAISYQWENLSGSISGATTNSYTAKTPNTYILKATLGPCTASSNSLVIAENPLPTATITPIGTVSFCNGDSLKIQATTSAGVTYQWLESGTPISGATSSLYYAKAVGEYSVKVTNATTGCTDKSLTLTVNIISPSVPTISAAGPTIFCLGDSVKLNSVVATGLTTQWQESNTDIPGAISGSYVTYASGVFRMKVTNGVGCAAYSTPIKVTVNSLPDNTLTISGGTDICNGSASVILAPIKLGYKYQWRNLGIDISGATGNPFYAKTAGTYSVHIVDSNGCQINSSDVAVTVKFVKPFYIHPYGNTFFCDGESTKLATQPGFTAYQWFLNGVYIPGATDTFIYAKKNGAYTVQVQDPTNSCFATSSGFNIIVIPAPDTPFITKVGSRLSTSVKGVAYQWYKNGITIVGATDSFIIVSSMNAIYAVVVTNDRNCSKRAEIDLNPSSIDEGISKTYFIKVYPNPTQDKLNIEAPEGITVSLKDIQGRVIFEQKSVKQIDMAQYAAGIYIIQFTDTNNQTIATEKISKIDY